MNLPFSPRPVLSVVLLPLLIAGCGTAGDAPRSTKPASPACHQTSPPSPRPVAHEDLVRDVADAWIERHPPESMHWDWGPAVLAYGMLDLYEATGDVRYREYVRSWVDHHAGSAPIFWSDTAAPAGLAARLARWSCDPTLLDVSDRTAAYIRGAPRTKRGGIGHLGFVLHERPQLWVDSLFMFGNVLLHRGETRESDQPWTLLTEQIRIFAAELQASSGWFRHALLREEPFPKAPVFWARGNAWIADILPRVLETIPADHPDRLRIEAVSRRLLKASLASQDPSGLWWTVANRPGETYLETSAAALFADGLRRAGRLGLIDGARAEAAYALAVSGVMNRIELRDGLATVLGTSTGTQPSTFAGYAAVPRAPDVNYGVGAVLLALTSPAP